MKLQTVNLAAKLCIANAKQSKLLCQYVLSLAKYDLNYDIRDRARFLHRLVLPSDVSIRTATTLTQCPLQAQHSGMSDRPSTQCCPVE